MKKIKNLSATMGKYTNEANEEKNRYVNCGSLFERDDGSLVVKLDSIPVGEEFTGWINCYDVDSNRSNGGGGYPDYKPIHHESVARQELAKDDQIPY